MVTALGKLGAVAALMARDRSGPVLKPSASPPAHRPAGSILASSLFDRSTVWLSARLFSAAVVDRYHMRDNVIG
jgi:hypothetical protein